LIFAAVKCFTQHVLCVSRSAKVFQRFLLSHQRRIYIFFTFLKRWKNRERKISFISAAPQEAKLCPSNKEPRDSSPKVRTFRRLVIPVLAGAHPESRHRLSQAPAGTLHPRRPARGLSGWILGGSEERRRSGAEPAQRKGERWPRGDRWGHWGAQHMVACWPRRLLHCRSFLPFPCCNMMLQHSQ